MPFAVAVAVAVAGDEVQLDWERDGAEGSMSRGIGSNRDLEELDLGIARLYSDSYLQVCAQHFAVVSEENL